jgi:GST-like protein
LTSLVHPTQQQLFFEFPSRQVFGLLSAKEKAEMSSKIQLYTLGTPNGMKIGIALEEMELEYDVHVIDINKNDQFTPEFIAINPNSKIPAIVDPDGPDGKPFAIFESGAILLYLAQKTGKFLSHDPRLKWETIQWLFFQMAGVGPMFGQFGHFFKTAKEKCKDPYPVERYANEVKRLLGVLEKRLEGREYLIDDGYSIADMATVPWIYTLGRFYHGEEKLEVASFPKVVAWKERCLALPATARGMKVASII